MAMAVLVRGGPAAARLAARAAARRAPCSATPRTPTASRRGNGVLFTRGLTFAPAAVCHGWFYQGPLRRRAEPAGPGGPPHHCRALVAAASRGNPFYAEVGVAVEGEPLGGGEEGAVHALGKTLARDAERLLEAAFEGQECRAVELSLLMCDDAYIQELNLDYRGKDCPTDVLSFEMGDEDQPVGYPNKVLGDAVISLDTARRQAEERGHTLEDEVRVLLVHGVLHLIGYDHELGQDESDEMAAQERRLLGAMGWKGEGLITGAEASAHLHGVVPRRVKVVVLDMDGTLLNGASAISPGTADAVKAALGQGVQVVLATGKARPAALAACGTVGLAGPEGIVSLDSPGVFLQGLACYGPGGVELPGGQLPWGVVEAAFRYAQEHGLALVGFQGDTCVTLDLKSQLVELHEVFYEPLASVAPSMEALLDGPPLKKMLFFADEPTVSGVLRPHWTAVLSAPSSGATVTQAVPDMLEILPEGVDKGVGVARMLAALGVDARDVLAVGDGENDLGMLKIAGLSVAMGNATALVTESADFVVSSNDDDGVAEALARFVL